MVWLYNRLVTFKKRMNLKTTKTHRKLMLLEIVICKIVMVVCAILLIAVMIKEKGVFWMDLKNNEVLGKIFLAFSGVTLVVVTLITIFCLKNSNT